MSNKKPSSALELPLQQRQELGLALQRFLDKELEIELEQFDTEALLDFISQHIGPHFYNKALMDAQTLLTLRLEDSFMELEQA
ncbi:DUF2164 domain-containing protein [Gallaecimonas mangrovi]|uniref:DUF2164 domain-containing protein n=1 Tax=Gallaecimonas mangrovi TaxID=2291597 RepID=UPI000E205167|nr:DUF2164 domain-containing protein [Gallaecimonas mangrovi]